MKKRIAIPQVIYTNQFLRFAAIYAKKFKAANGYGRWLAEYKRMDEAGMFSPENIRRYYIKILKGTSDLTYIYWDAIRYIGIQALDATNTFFSDSYEIRVITGEIAVDDNDKKLIGLSIEDALSICKTMNQEAEELLFIVYNSNTNKIIK